MVLEADCGAVRQPQMKKGENRMFSKRAFPRLCVVALVAVALAGCTGETPQQAPTPAPTPIQQMEKPEPAPAPSEPAPAPEPEPEAADDWTFLFNSVDLTGWQSARDPQTENKWFVEDGTLTNMDHGNDIATVDQWKDFDLEIEYKTVPEGNSGVYLRGRIEIQVFDSHGKEQVEHADAGGIYGQFAPLVNAALPAGEWNKIEASYVGDRLTVKLNGQLVQDNIQIVEVTGGALPGGVDEPGPLMLQGDHGKVWYRNIKLRSHDAMEEGSAPETEGSASEEMGAEGTAAEGGAEGVAEGEGTAETEGSAGEAPAEG